MREYQECYIAFLDLLGFKNSIKAMSCEEIAEYFDEINKEYITAYDRTKQPLVNNKALHYKVMSDSICVYIDCTEKNALAGLIAACDYFQVRMLRLERPVLIRGAIVKGQIFSQKDTTFGPGLTDAYLIEENVSKFPRIILTKSTIDEWENHDIIGKNYVDMFTFCDIDNFYAIDYLYLFYGLNHEQNSWKSFAKHVYKVLDTETDPSIREKYIYIKNSINRVRNKFMSYIEEQNHE